MKIFVSYRREDTQPIVARLCSRLDQAFGSRNVFYDERSVGAGTDFLGAVGGAIYTSDAILVVIGRLWTSVRDARGRLRLDDPDDPVGWEVGLGLASGRVLIPLLVDGASMPTKGDLPGRLQHLTTRSGLRLESGARFDQGVDDLIMRLGGPTSNAASQFRGSRAPRATTSWASFEGHWQTRDGGWAEITQDGDMIEMHGSASNGAVYEARGRVQGQQAVLEFSNSFGLRGRMAMELVQNGAYINGQVQSPMGASPFDMMRRT